MKIAGKAFIIVYRAASLLLVAAAAVVLALLIFNIRPYAVVTGSMEPVIPQGSVCFADQRAAFGDIQEGDIIIFRLGSLLVTHRAVRVDETGVTTKGDANNTEDTSGKLTEENYIGKVIFWVPSVGRFLMYARTVTGRIAVIGGFALFFAAGFLYDRLSARRGDDE